MDFYDANNGIAVCNANGTPYIARTTDGGASWIQDTIPNTILSQSTVYSGFIPVQMVNPNAAFTQIVVSTSKRYIIGYGQASAGLDENTGIVGTDVLIYPNPTEADKVTIEAESLREVRVINNQGQLVLLTNEFQNGAELDLHGLDTGVYHVMIIGEDYTTNRKLIIK